MTTARDIMSGSAESARAADTLVGAARKMTSLDVGALPICGDDDLPDDQIARLVEAISAAAANN